MKGKRERGIRREEGNENEGERRKTEGEKMNAGNEKGG